MGHEAGHMTKLEAVNDILWSIGESPVNSLSSGVPDAEQAEAILDRVSRTVQIQGWKCNTLKNYTLTQDSLTRFLLPNSTLKVDTVNPTGNRISGTAAPSSQHVNVVMRRSIDDKSWLLWDADKNTETWADGPDTLLTEIVQFKDFVELAPALQMYVWAAAAHRFQKGAMGSAVLFEYTIEDVNDAKALAVQEDTETDDTNMLRDNAHVARIVRRNNPAWGT